MRTSLLAAFLCVLPLSIAAQETPVALTCLLNVMCPHTGACRDLSQTIVITEENVGWTVEWIGTDLPSDYEIVGDLQPPIDAVEQTRVRSLILRDAMTQTMQMVTFDNSGNVVVTTHQPQAGMQVVTGIGSCEPS